MGRKVEETMLFIVSKYARNMRLDKVVVKYIQTTKNNLCMEF